MNQNRERKEDDNMKKEKIIFGMILLMIAAIATSVCADIAENNIQIRDSTEWDLYIAENALVNQDPDPAEPGSFVDLRFKIENIGSDVTKNAIFEIVPEYPFTSYNPQDGRITIGDIYSRQVGDTAYVLNFKLKVDEKAVEGMNQVRLRYSLDDGMSWTVTPAFDVRVRTYDAILYVKDITSEPKMVPQGGTMELKMALENIADTPLKNVQIGMGLMYSSSMSTSFSMDATSSALMEIPLSPLDGANEQVVKHIAANSVEEVTFTLIADPDAEAAVYKIPLLITYNDHLGNEYSKDVLISTIIGDLPDLIVSAESSDIKKAGDTGVVTIKFVNKGFSELKFLHVMLEESDKYSIFSSEGVYVGNIDSDDYETVDYTIYLKDDGASVDFPIHLEYTDSNNNRYEEDIEVGLKLFSAKEIKMMQPQGSKGTGIFIIIVIVVAGLLIYRWRKKKKLKAKTKEK